MMVGYDLNMRLMTLKYIFWPTRPLQTHNFLMNRTIPFDYNWHFLSIITVEDRQQCTGPTARDLGNLGYEPPAVPLRVVISHYNRSLVY